MNLAVARILPGTMRIIALLLMSLMSTQAPELSLTDSKGAPVKLSSYRGKVVLLNFWATTCGGCKVEIPWFVEFQNKYRREGLAVIGVSLDADGWKSVKPYLRQHKINYTVAVGNEDIEKRFGVEALPLTLLIDREGRIAATHSGLVDKEACEKEIRE